MIYEDERTVDEMIDDILKTDKPVRAEETPSAGGAQMRPDERATCRRCGKTFARQAGSTRTLCPECFAASHSRKRPAANDRQMKTGDEDPVQKAWDELATEANTEASQAPERAPESHPREAREVLMDLYSTVRSLARAAGLDPSRTIEALWEVDSIFGNVGTAGRI